MSRLSADAAGMVQPTRMLLSYLVSSLVFFVGGLAMCFLTSWRLTLLAFTTIGPIGLIYRTFLEWYRRITRYVRRSGLE